MKTEAEIRAKLQEWENAQHLAYSPGTEMAVVATIEILCWVLGEPSRIGRILKSSEVTQ